MKKLLILILFLIISCAPVQTEKKINFSKDLTFEEFKSNFVIYLLSRFVEQDIKKINIRKKNIFISI